MIDCEGFNPIGQADPYEYRGLTSGHHCKWLSFTPIQWSFGLFHSTFLWHSELAHWFRMFKYGIDHVNANDAGRFDFLRNAIF